MVIGPSPFPSQFVQQNRKRDLSSIPEEKRERSRRDASSLNTDEKLKPIEGSPWMATEDDEKLKPIEEDKDDADKMEMGVLLRPTQTESEKKHRCVRREEGPIEETWTKAAKKFESDVHLMSRKIPKFPPFLQGLGSRYIVPMAVSIGPYHHGLEHLRDMEKVKYVAAHHFVQDSEYSLEEMHAAVLGVAGAARSFYDADAMEAAGIDGHDFQFIMFRDGCFLLQYMLMLTTDPEDLSPLLRCLFDPIQPCISNDIMLLENQLPWLVIKTLMRFRPVNVEEFVAKMGRTLQLQGDEEGEKFSFHDYSPPHLLGLLRFYKIGNDVCPSGVPRRMSKTTTAIELAEIGVNLAPGETTKFSNMGIKRKLFTADFFLAPILLDEIRSCWLINMAALEVYMGMSIDTGTPNPVISSYLAIFAMLMDREEDVHKLRSKHLLQGELTNTEVLQFFKSIIKRISGGPLYIHIMVQIDEYKRNRRMWIKVYGFIYKNYKLIAAVLSLIGALVGIFKTLLSLKQH